MSEVELESSVKKVGRLVPIIKDAHGNIIDGFHRQKVDPQWSEEFSIKLDHIHDPIQLLLARMNVNVCRRMVDAEEKTEWLRSLVELTGWDAKRIAEESGMSYSWVLKYLPEEFKDKAKAEVGKVGGIESGASRREAKESEDMRQEEEKKLPSAPRVKCECCNKEVLYPKYLDVEGRLTTVCGLCRDKLRSGEITLPEKKVPKRQPKTIEPPKETWQERKAHMTPQVSNMEEKIRVALTSKGVAFENDRMFCLQQTTPDFYFPTQNLAVYLDGPVHEKRQDRDDLLRELLAKRYGVKVLSIPYEGTSQTEEDKVLRQIMEEAS